jgi:DNA-binding NtrC family response regulator
MDRDDDDRPSAATLEIAMFERSHGWVLDVQDDEGGRQVPLVEGRVVVGSSSRADVVVNDPTVSSLHCALSVVRGGRGGVAIEDLGSKNGTFVGGARVKEARGEVGTTIVMGHTSVGLGAMPEGEDEDDLAAPLQGVVGASSAMRRLAAKVRRFAKHALPVLVTGESGTGKELVSRALHDEGPRMDSPFVAINVAALPRELVESELFGHERGAFTGAVARRMGAFTEAEGGTLFLDEIGDLPIDAQPKLLRALDGYEVRRVGTQGGGKKPNVRIVAATNVPLAERVDKAAFRLDLFHRLNIFVVAIPPLRDRKGDIAPIARELLAASPRNLGRRDMTSRALARLVSHDWPGNVRELRGVLLRALDATRGARAIDAIDIERAIQGNSAPPPLALTHAQARALLGENGGNLSAAARAAGIPRTTFRKLMKG